MAKHFTVGGYPNPDPHYVSPEEEAQEYDILIESRRLTIESDAELKAFYESLGVKAFYAGEPREFTHGDPNSMIGGWWFGGWDGAADQHS